MTEIFEFIKEIFTLPLGLGLSFFYNLTNNYILATVMVAILLKCCFLPNAIKQQKNLVKTKVFNEKVKLVKEKHSDDPERLNQVMKKLKEQEPKKKNNLGCLTTIIHLVVMISFFGVIYTPLSNVLQIENGTITEMQVVLAEASEEHKESNNISEIELMKETENHKEELLANNVLTEEKINEIISFKEKYKFLGIDLSANPQLTSFDELWLIPLLVLLTGIMLPLQAFIKRKIENPNQPKFPAIEALPFISPMMIFLFAFMFSAGVGFYWIISNLLNFIQTMVFNIVFTPKKVEIFIEENDNAPEELPSSVLEIAE